MISVIAFMDTPKEMTRHTNATGQGGGRSFRAGTRLLTDIGKEVQRADKGSVCVVVVLCRPCTPRWPVVPLNKVPRPSRPFH